eukprot:37376-Hanusia_phi.AAC.1
MLPWSLDVAMRATIEEMSEGEGTRNLRELTGRADVEEKKPASEDKQIDACSGEVDKIESHIARKQAWFKKKLVAPSLSFAPLLLVPVTPPADGRLLRERERGRRSSAERASGARGLERRGARGADVACNGEEQERGRESPRQAAPCRCDLDDGQPTCHGRAP